MVNVYLNKLISIEKKRINLNKLNREHIHIMKNKLKIGTKPTTK